MRRICIFCETWKTGGIESFICSVLEHMDMTGIEVDIVATKVCQGIFLDRLKKKSIRIIQLSGDYRFFLKNGRMFRKLLKNGKYDLIHFNLFQGMSLYYSHIAKTEGVPIRIVHSHNTDLRHSVTKPFKLILHNLYKHLFTSDATALWACSKKAAEFLFDKKTLLRKGYLFIPNGIDIEKFRFDSEKRKKIRRELKLDNAVVYGNVGRLCNQKNQSFLIKLLPLVLKKQPNALLLLIGEGEDKYKLVHLAKKLNVAEKIIFYGTTDRIAELFLAMDVFVFPSKFEGLGIVAIEAQTSGLPVVASEDVPKEAFVDKPFFALPLKEEKKKWVYKLIEFSGKRRNEGAFLIARRKGFDIQYVSRLIENEFRYN